MKDPVSHLKMSCLLLLVCLTFFFSGCVGWGLWQPLQDKPYTYIKGGDQFARDQMTNRRLIAMQKVFIQGKSPNEVLSILGQPQEIRVVEQNISQDWYFIYYKGYLPYVDKVTERTFEPHLDRGTFIVRIRYDRVIDVVKVN